MNRVDLQAAVEDAITIASKAVMARKGHRYAMRVGVYRLGDRIFACLDGENAIEVKGDRFTELPAAEFDRYIRPEYDATYSEFNDGVPVETLQLLLEMFCEVVALYGDLGPYIAAWIKSMYQIAPFNGRQLVERAFDKYYRELWGD